MSARMRTLGTAVFSVALLAGAGHAGAQLAEPLRGMEDGVVRFTQPLRPGARVCTDGIRTGALDRQRRGRDAGCLEGTADVEIRFEGGSVTSVEVLRPTDRPDGSATEIGRVSGAEAAEVLLEIAGRAPPGVAEDALVGAVLADSAEVWPGLLQLARERARPGRVRRSALFWLGQEAATAVTEALAETASDEDEDAGIREAAVFALSQRPQEESVPVLMDLARTASHADTRRSALFWLAQSEDPRVPEFFGDLLRGPG